MRILMLGNSFTTANHMPDMLDDRSLTWKIKRFTNDELRQRFVDNTVPQVEMLGMTVPDPDLHFDTESGHYRFGEIDWQEFNEVINGRGICNQERLDAKRKAWEEGT